ncbi:MAG: NADH:flavin oxidoreductase [Promethearchaeota archaeon]
MANLFSPSYINRVEIKNKFICSAIYEGLATTTGEVTEKLVNRYRKLAKGGAGLIISGMTYISPSGKSAKYQIGTHDDGMIEGLKRIVNTVHENGSKILFQLNHAGRQTNKQYCGEKPMAPSSQGRDMVYFTKPRKMNTEDIEQTILEFGQSTRRVIEAGADGIQIHAAHGYLINQFLSPHFNKRMDKWGGSEENRFRFLKRVVLEVKKYIPKDKIIAVKIGTKEVAGKNGIQIDLLRKYAEWLSNDLHVHAIEISAGSVLFMFPNMIRGEMPTKEFLTLYPKILSPIVKLLLKKMGKGREFADVYNLETAKVIKPVLKNTKLILVGGIRKKSDMCYVTEKKYADFLSFGRPFINNPDFVNHLQEGKDNPIKCINCNRCFAAAGLDYEIQCYINGLPQMPKRN